MKFKLKVIIQLFKDSGLKVNEAKTEKCLFYRKDNPQVEIAVSGVQVKSKDHMNVLDVVSHIKLTWAKHVAFQTNKANSTLHAIKLIKNTSIRLNF